jgi:DNA-binding transcriptional LysR family regulator
MEFRQLEAMKLIANTGSFQAAARQLSLTKSALSHQMRSLEEELGEQLLVRARPKIYPTPAGQRLLLSAERIFAEVSGIKDQFGKSLAEKSAGAIRVAGTHIAITYVYGDLIEEFVTRHRAIEIIFHATEFTEDSVTRVLQRSADIGFAVLPQSHPQLVVTPMVKAEQVFVVGRTHPLAKEKSVTIRQLRDWPFVRFEQKTGQRIVSDRVFGASGNYPRILAESNDVEYVKRIIRMGLGGVALMPVFCVRKELAEGTLHALRLNTGRIVQDAGFVSRKDVNGRALSLFRNECLSMRGRSARMLTLEGLEHPVFGPPQPEPSRRQPRERKAA